MSMLMMVWARPRFEFFALNIPYFARSARDNHVSKWLKCEFSADEGLRKSRETIYRCLFVEARGVLMLAGKAPRIILDRIRRNGLYKELRNKQTWRRDYNEYRPKKVLGGLPPANYAARLATRSASETA